VEIRPIHLTRLPNGAAASRWAPGWQPGNLFLLRGSEGRNGGDSAGSAWGRLAGLSGGCAEVLSGRSLGDPGVDPLVRGCPLRYVERAELCVAGGYGEHRVTGVSVRL
jgi:hypothetical protein